MFGDLYGAGAIVGFSPFEVGRSSLWELAAAIAGYARAHGAEDGPAAMTEAESEKAAAILDAAPMIAPE